MSFRRCALLASKTATSSLTSSSSRTWKIAAAGAASVSSVSAEGIDAYDTFCASPVGFFVPRSLCKRLYTTSASAAPKPNVITVSGSNYETKVKKSEKPVLLDAYADWCGPCRRLTPVLEKLAADGNGQFVLGKMNIDDNEDLANQLGVESIPAVFAIIDGKVVAKFTGALPEAQVREFIKEEMGVEL